MHARMISLSVRLHIKSMYCVAGIQTASEPDCVKSPGSSVVFVILEGDMREKPNFLTVNNNKITIKLRFKS